MTNAQRKAITNIINAIDDIDGYIIDRNNSEEQNQAIAAFLKTLFVVENGKVKDFNEEVVEAFAVLQRRPKIKLL